MPAEVLLFSDLHIHSHKKSTERLQDCLDVLAWIFDTAVEREIRHVIFLGDLFHDRMRIEVQTLHRTHEVFEKYFYDPKFDLYLLLGNHDMWSRDKWDIYSPKVVSGWDAVHVIDHPQNLNILGQHFDFLPFTENPIQEIADLLAQPSKSERRVLCSHMALDGAILNSFGIHADVVVEHDNEMVKVDADFLRKWDRVFLGHYHAPQMINDRVEYVGSPLQLTFGEAHQEKHLAVFDVQNFTTEYVVNEFSRKHIVTTLGNLPNHDLKDNFVIVKVDDLSRDEVTELRKKINREHSVKTLDIKVTMSSDPGQETMVEDAKSILDTEDVMLLKYIKEKGSGMLDPDLLIREGIAIIQGAAQK